GDAAEVRVGHTVEDRDDRADQDDEPGGERAGDGEPCDLRVDEPAAGRLHPGEGPAEPAGAEEPGDVLARGGTGDGGRGGAPVASGPVESGEGHAGAHPGVGELMVLVSLSLLSFSFPYLKIGEREKEREREKGQGDQQVWQ